MARRVSARLPKATSAMTSSVAGLMTPSVLPELPSHHWPSINMRLRGSRCRRHDRLLVGGWWDAMVIVSRRAGGVSPLILKAT